MCVLSNGLHRLTCIAGLLTIPRHERFMTPCAEALILPVGAMLSLIFARCGIHICFFAFLEWALLVGGVLTACTAIF